MNNKLNRVLISISIVILLIAIGASEASATKTTNEEEPYTYYWIFSQNPSNTTLYIYAKYGADVTVSGTNSAPVTVYAEPGIINTYNVADLGFNQTEKEWFFLELKSSQKIMVSFDRVSITHPNQYEYLERHGDAICKKPPMELSTEYYYAFGQSGAGDDILALYSTEPTTVTARRFTNLGEIFTKTFEIDGLFISPKLQLFLGSSNKGYGLTVTADKPIASGLFDESMWWPTPGWGTGYFGGNVGLTELYDEYMHIHHTPNEYMTLYTPTANDISFYDENNDLVGTRNFEGEASTFPRPPPVDMYYKNIGYNTTSPPYLVHAVGSADFVETRYSPVATDVVESAAYIGHNASWANLQIYTTSATEIKIINGIDNSMLNFTIEAKTTVVKSIDVDLGFAPNQPFLMNVISDVPVYQQVRNPFNLRKYPMTIGPGIEPTIRIEPETLNLNSKGQFTAFIKLPDGFDLNNIDISTLVCEGAPALDGNVADNNHLLVKFDRVDLVGVEPGDEVTFTVEGYFYDGTPFVGWDMIRVIDNRK
jgi:hypothetical protein